MEPQLPAPNFTPENAPQPPFANRGEVLGAPRRVEIQAPLEQGKESHEVVSDGPKGDPAAAQFVLPPPPLPVIDPAQLTRPHSQQTVVQDNNPISADDVDLIEKEWVDKAKKVVSETRNDPNAQESAISKLQADYLQKRYGKVVKLPSDG